MPKVRLYGTFTEVRSTFSMPLKLVTTASGVHGKQLRWRSLVVMINLPHLRNEEDLRKMGKKLLVGGVEAQCCSGQGLTVHHWPRGGRH